MAWRDTSQRRHECPNMVTMGKAKSRSRIERRLADMAVPTPVAEPWLPDPDECEDHPPYTFDLGPDARVIVRLRTHVTRLVEFALIQQVRYDGQWREVVKIDTAHGEVHAHWFHHSGAQSARTVLQPIRNVDDVDEGYRRAESIVFDNWQTNQRRWQRGD